MRTKNGSGASQDATYGSGSPNIKNKVGPKGAGSNPNDSKHKSKGHDDTPQSGNTKKRNPGGLANKRYGAFGGYKGVKYSDAADLVKPQIKQQIRQLRRERKNINRDVRDNRQDIRGDYQETVGDLGHIYDESGDFIASQNALIAQQFADNKSRAEQAQAALAAQLAQNAQGNAGFVDDELSRLGIQGSGNMGQFAADQTYAQDTASIGGANNIANLNLMAQGSATVGSLLAGMNEGSRSSQLGQALNNKNEAMQQVKNNKMDAMLDVRQAIRDAKSDRPDLINAMLNQLAQTGWAQFVDSKNLSMQQQQLNMQRQAQAFAQRQAMGGGGSAGGGGGSYGGGSSGGSSPSPGGSSPTPQVSQPPTGGKPKPKPKGRNNNSSPGAAYPPAFFG